MPRNQILRVVFCVFLLGATAGVAAMSSAPAEPYVISSVKPLQLLVTAIAGDEIDSRLLLPPHVDAHHYAPRPSDLRQLDRAAVVFWIGPEYEGGLAALLADQDGALALAPRVRRDIADPHIWMSPVQVRAVVPVIVEALVAVLPMAAPRFEDNAAAFLADLSNIDAKYAKIFGATSLRKVLVYHNAYAPLIAHFGLDGVESITGAEHHLAGTRTMAALRRALQQGEIGCVMREIGGDQAAGMRALLDGIDVQIVELDPLGTTFENHRAGFLRYFEQLVAAFAACSDVALVHHDAGNIDSTSTP